MEDRTPLRPLGVGEILDVAINIVLKNAGTLVRTVLVVVVPIQVLSIAILATTLPDADLLNNRNAFTGNDPDVDIDGSDLTALLVGFGLVGVLGFVLTAFATAACFKAISDAYLGAKPDWRDSLRFARDRFASVMWVTVLVALGVIVAMIGFIIPGIWLYVAWSVAVPALLLENLRGSKALGRSFRLVKGRWWRTFGTLLVGFILAAVVGGILSGLVSAVALTDVGDSVLGAAIVNGISSGVGQLVTTPVTVAIVTVIYYDLLVRKEGVHLETLVERLGVTPEPGRRPRAAERVIGWSGQGGPPPTAPGWQGQAQAGAPAPAQRQGPPPTGAGWQGTTPERWQGAEGWRGPEPPSPTDSPPAAPPAGPGPAHWAPPRPPGSAPDQGGDGPDPG